MNTLRDEWNEYRDRVVPKDASPTQLQETRRAWYGGAWAMLQLQIGNAGDDVSEEANMALLMGWQQELLEFKTSVGTPWEGQCRPNANTPNG